MTKEEGRKAYSAEICVWNCRSAKLGMEYTWPFCPEKYAQLKEAFKKLEILPDEEELQCIKDGSHFELYAGAYYEFSYEVRS